MTVGELIKRLADYSPDTPVRAMDGNLLTGDILELYYGDVLQDSGLLFEANDGEGDNPEAVYLMTP